MMRTLAMVSLALSLLGCAIEPELDTSEAAQVPAMVEEARLLEALRGSFGSVPLDARQDAMLDAAYIFYLGFDDQTFVKSFRAYLSEGTSTAGNVCGTYAIEGDAQSGVLRLSGMQNCPTTIPRPNSGPWSGPERVVEYKTRIEEMTTPEDPTPRTYVRGLSLRPQGSTEWLATYGRLTDGTRYSPVR